MTIILACASLLGVGMAAYGLGCRSERARARAVLAAEPFPEPDPADIADEDEEEDVCLRVGMRVICRLSETSHTHGVIMGFTGSGKRNAPMLAIINVGDAPPMSIDVDMVVPGGNGPPSSYRTNANPKQWN